MAMNTMKDLHICGTCKNIFSEDKLFSEHKTTCFLPDSPAENLICSTDMSVDSALFTNQWILDKMDLENGVFPLILQFDKVTADTSVLEVYHSQEKEDIIRSENSKIIGEIISENDVTPFLTNQVPKEVIKLENKKFNSHTSKSCANKKSREVNGVTLETAKKVNSNKKKRNACGVCDFVTKRRHDLIRHMHKHSGERMYECNICDKKFARQDKLLVHKRIHFGDKRYKCQFCEYANTDGGALKAHLRIHLDKRPHKCQICSYSARNASHLTVHLRVHTGDCPFICQLALCGRGFKTSSDLKRHMKVHMRKNLATKTYSHEDLPETISSNHLPKNENSVKKTSSCFGCKYVCHKGVKKNCRGKSKHGVNAISVKVHECPHCSASFVRQDSLNSHLRQHPQSSLPPDNPLHSNVESCLTSSEPIEDQLVEPFLCDQELLSLDNFVTVPYISDSSVL